MPITFACGCGRQLRARDEFAGRRVRCPGCGAVLTVPAAEGPAPERGPSETETGAIPPPLPPPPPAPSGRAAPGRGTPLPARRPLRRAPAPSVPGDEPPALPKAPGPAPAPAAVPRRSIRDYAYLALLLALIPLALSLAGDDGPSFESRLKATLENAPPEAAERVAGVLQSDDATVDDLLDALPEGRLEGAHLPRRTWMHWGYALASAAAFFALLLLFFRDGGAAAGGLAGVGLFTGTAGILLLLAVQFIAGWTQGMWVKGSGVLVVVFYIVKFIGFSYSSALDPNTNFFLSALGFTCGVGFCEELCKALPVIWHYRRSAALPWRGACLWGLASGVGFGVAEGITYSSDTYNGVLGAEIYVVRFVSCVALHAVWSAGVAVLLYRGQRMIQGEMEWYEMLWSVTKLLLVAMVLHGFYDTMLKKEMNGLALVVAVVSFAWLAWLIERMRRLEAAA